MSNGPFDIFLKLDGIDGESKKLDKHIDILSWSWGQTNGAHVSTGEGLSAGKASANDLSISMAINKATPYILKACANGTHIKTADLVCRKAGTGAQEYLRLTFSPVVVSSYQTGGSGGDDIPVDSISLCFSKIEYKYSPQKAGGGLDTAIPISYDYSTAKEA